MLLLMPQLGRKGNEVAFLPRLASTNSSTISIFLYRYLFMMLIRIVFRTPR